MAESRSLRGFLSLADLPGEALHDVLDAAAAIAANRPRADAVAGKRVALLFMNPSLRTRASMELAVSSQGGHVVALVPGADAWKVETRRGAVMDGDAAEHLVDAVRVLSSMADLIAVRTFAGLRSVADDLAEPILSLVAAESSVPVVNMESAFDHPLQALADLATMREDLGGGRDSLRGVPVTLTWAPHPRALPMAVGAAFLRGAARAGMDVRVATPAGFELPGAVIDEARGLLPGSGNVECTGDREAALRGTRFVYAKAWAAPAHYGDVAAGAALRERHRDWTVDQRAMGLTDDAAFLHCLPVRRNVVVSDAVVDGPRSLVVREAEYRLHTACAVLARLLGSRAGRPVED